MAAIWVSQKCCECGKSIKAGETAVLIAEVKTTNNDTYGNYKKGRWSLRVNFFSKGDRKLKHIECPEK